MTDVAALARYRRFLTDTHVGLQHEVAEHESDVTATKSFVCGLVPGLLQTPQYASGVFERMAALMGMAPAGTGPDAVAARMARQQVLDGPKQFHYLIPESVLYIPLCSTDGMRAQLERLAAETRRPNLRLGVIPLDAAVELVPFHSFTVYDERSVAIEMFTGELTLTGEDDVRLHLDAFARLGSSALYDEGARELFADARARLA